MNRFAPLALLVALATGCSGARTGPGGPIPFQPGEYLLQGSVSYRSDAGTKVDRHEAELVVEPDGRDMTMISSTGLCQGPPLPEVGMDQALGVRTFVCGEARYELRAAAGTIRGDLIATVIELVRETVCVEYRTNPSGQRVCVRTEERTVERPTQKRARLNVIVES